MQQGSISQKIKKIILFTLIFSILCVFFSPVLASAETEIPESSQSPEIGNEESFTPENTPEETPVTTPEITPEITPETTTEITPEITPEITLDATSEATPDVTPTQKPTATSEVTPAATPEATPEATPVMTPDATPEETPEATPEATATPTPSPTIKPTPSPTIHRLTAPPYYIEGETARPETTPTLTPENTPLQTESVAIINPGSMSQIDEPTTRVDSPLSAMIRYLSYALYGLAGFVVAYAVIAIFILLIFGKDISISGLRNSRKEKKKR